MVTTTQSFTDWALRIDRFNQHECGMHGIGSELAETMLIGIAPGKDEATRSHEPFTGPAGKLLMATLKAHNIERQDVYLTNLLCWWKDAPTDEEIDECWPRILNEISRVKPKLLILLGGIVSNRFLGHKNDKKKTPLWKRGHLYWRELAPDHYGWVMPTYHPATFLRDNSKVDVADFAKDIGKIKLVPEKPLEINYTIAENAEEANAIVWSVSGFNYIDVETSYDGLEFRYGDPKLLAGTEDSKMLCFSITNERGTWVIPGQYIPSLRRGWASRENVTWGMHLGQFDKAQFKRLINEDIYIQEDSLLQSYSLDERGGQAEENERAVGIHGLKGLSAEYFGIEDYDLDVLSALPDALHHYNAIDTIGGYNLVKLFKPLQEADNVRSMYENILIPGANALSEIQAYGILIDKKELYRQGAKWTERWLTLHEMLRHDAYELGWKGEPINVGSWQQLQKFFFDVCMLPPHPEWGKSTRKEVVEWFANKGFDWCKTLLVWRGIDHILSNYIVAVEEQIKYDGRIHPQAVQHGTRSGRLAYKKPPINTIPKHGVDPELAEVRKMYIAGEGRLLLEADLKQAELYAVTYLSGDEVMLAGLLSGDAHGETAKEVFNTDESNPMWKGLRELGKLINFGTLYNRTAEGYAKNIWQGRKAPAGMEDFRWTKQQAQAYINKWYAKYQVIRAWQKEQTKQALTTGEQVTWNGRKRRYWLPTFKTVNQSVNLGPQTLAHDYLFDSLMKCHKALKPLDAHVLFEVHDALVVEAPEGRIDDVKEIVTNIMSEPKFGLPGIPCDVAVGPNWWALEKVA